MQIANANDHLEARADLIGRSVLNSLEGSEWRRSSRTSATCSSPDSDATRDNQLGRQALHHLVSLIARQASHSGDPSIWPGSRGSDVQDFAFDLQTVTGAGWIWPIKLTASPDDTASDRHAALDQEAHGDRSRVPTACRQARKQGVPGHLVIKVEGLRIRTIARKV